MEYVQVPDESSGDFEAVKETARRIEWRTGADVEFDGTTAMVRSEQSLHEQYAADTIRAVTLGFDVNTAIELLDDTARLATIDVSDHTRNRKECRRQIGRIIGSDGRTKELMAELTGANVVIDDKVVGIIGGYNEVQAVRRAVMMLIDGASHSRVYTYLEQYNQKPTIRMQG